MDTYLLPRDAYGKWNKAYLPITRRKWNEAESRIAVKMNHLPLCVVHALALRHIWADYITDQYSMILQENNNPFA